MIEKMEKETSSVEDSFLLDLQLFNDKFSNFLFPSWISMNEHNETSSMMEDAIKKLIFKYSSQFKYKDDVRYLNLWLWYAKLSWNSLPIYNEILNSGIGRSHAILYEEIAAYFEYKEKSIAKAGEIFQLGIEKVTLTKERLEKAYISFKQRNGLLQTIYKKELPGYQRNLLYDDVTGIERSFEEIRALWWREKEKTALHLACTIDKNSSFSNPFINSEGVLSKNSDKKKKTRESSLLKRLNELENSEKENTNPCLNESSFVSASPSFKGNIEKTCPFPTSVVKETEKKDDKIKGAIDVSSLFLLEKRFVWLLSDVLKHPKNVTEKSTDCTILSYLQRCSIRSLKYSRRSIHPRKSLAKNDISLLMNESSSFSEHLPFLLDEKIYRFIQKLPSSEVSESFLIQDMNEDLDETNSISIPYYVLHVSEWSNPSELYVLHRLLERLNDSRLQQSYFLLPTISYLTQLSENPTLFYRSYTLFPYISQFTLQDLMLVNRISKNMEIVNTNEKYHNEVPIRGVEEIIAVSITSQLLDCVQILHSSKVFHQHLQLSSILFVHNDDDPDIDEQQSSKIGSIGTEIDNSQFRISLTNFEFAEIIESDNASIGSMISQDEKNFEDIDPQLKKWMQSQSIPFQNDRTEFFRDYYDMVSLIYQLLLDGPLNLCHDEERNQWRVNFSGPMEEKFEYMLDLWVPLFKFLLNPCQQRVPYERWLDELVEWKERADIIIKDYEGRYPSLNMLLKRLYLLLYEM